MTASMPNTVPALVVGGGISGLVCAYALRKKSIAAQVVEASALPGGFIRSEKRDGYLLELGPQSFSGTAALRELCAELGIADQLLQAPPTAPRYVLVKGQLRAVPLNPIAFFASGLFDFSTKLALVRDVLGKSKPPERDETIAEFVRRKFSAQFLDRIVAPLVSGIYAGDAERLSVRSAFPQFYEAEKAAGSIVRGMMLLAATKPKKGPRERRTLQTFREGNDTLVRALANQLGPALRPNTRVTSISRANDGGFEVQLQRDGTGETFSAKSLILATPIEITGALLAKLDSTFPNQLGAAEYASVAVVSLGYRKQDIAHDLNGFGFLVPRSAGLRILGTVWNSSLFPNRAPEGHALLTTFLAGTTDPEAAELPPAKLTTLTHRELSPILSFKGDPVFCHVKIWQNALPQYNLGHSDRLAAVTKACSRFPGLQLIGNYLRGPAIGTCVDQALAAAEATQQYLAS
jgi:protoporphyrinogen/coproporphyrinogen III oxidase